MEHFFVCEITPPTVTLLDRSGRRHRVRITCDLPVLGSQLWGQPPGLGLSILFGSDGGEVYRAIFEEAEPVGPETARGSGRFESFGAP